jgi:hypothetical protein
MVKHDKFTSEDKEYLNKRKKVAEDLGKPEMYELIDHFPLYCGIMTLSKCLAISEIVRKILNLPGHIIEFGCHKGSNLMLISKLIQLFQPHQYKYVYGFESFEGLQTFSNKDDVSEKLRGRYSGSKRIIEKMIDLYDMNDYVHIIEGDAIETIPKFEKDNPHLLFSLAYLDFDLYEPTIKALRFIKNRIVSGGLIAFD